MQRLPLCSFALFPARKGQRPPGRLCKKTLASLFSEICKKGGSPSANAKRALGKPDAQWLEAPKRRTRMRPKGACRKRAAFKPGCMGRFPLHTGRVSHARPKSAVSASAKKQFALCLSASIRANCNMQRRAQRCRAAARSLIFFLALRSNLYYDWSIQFVMNFAIQCRRRQIGWQIV